MEAEISFQTFSLKITQHTTPCRRSS